jgi:hypothetical protein
LRSLKIAPFLASSEEIRKVAQLLLTAVRNKFLHLIKTGYVLLHSFLRTIYFILTYVGTKFSLKEMNTRKVRKH